MVQQILKTKRGKWALALAVIAVIGSVVLLSEGNASSLPGALILIAISVLLALSALKDAKKTPASRADDNTPASAQQVIESNGIKLTISTTTTERDVSYLLADGEKISKLDLGWGENPSGGYVNWLAYEVTGVNEKGKPKSKKYHAKTESEAIADAKADGFNEPIEVHIVPHDPPTEKQIKYLLSWKATVPPGATKYDVSAMLDRLEGSCDTVSEVQISEKEMIHYIRPLPGPSVEFAKYADSVGVHFSSFIGADALFNNVLDSINERERAAFFAYCALCSYHRFDIGNLRDTPYASRLYDFADAVMQDASVINSIAVRSAYDYKTPHKGTKAYKAVAEFFGLK